MDFKERVEEFQKVEESLKIDLLAKIQEEFAKYGKKKVTFRDPRYDDYFNQPEEIQKELDHLMDLVRVVNPLVMDKYCDIDGTATPAYMELNEKGLFLHVFGENWEPENKFITLQKPEWGLMVTDLYGLLKLLQSDLVKKLNDSLID